MSAARRARWGVAVVALLTSVALTPVPALASHGHAPSARDVARGKALVAQREREVATESANIVAAKARLAALNARAEVAFEAYDGAKLKLAAANKAVRTAHVVLNGANRQVAAGQAKITRFARLSYESNGLSSMAAYLSPGGPSQLAARVGEVGAISSSEQTTLQELDAAQIYQAVVSHEAEAVAATATAAAARATKAKAAAASAVHDQGQELAGLHREQARLRTLLASAEAHATALERAHLAAIARARARAAARALAAAAAQQAANAGPSPYAGASGSLAGTVTASEGTSALSAAESQLGKPYQWAAAGPSTYDCSGLTMWAYNTVGVHLEHWTHDQWVEGAHVSRSELRPGDLVFFATNTSDPATIHHVGMYVGNGEMIDAPFTGANVRYDGAFRPDYIGAVRPYQR